MFHGFPCVFDVFPKVFDRCEGVLGRVACRNHVETASKSAQVEDAELRSFATGLAQGANNFLGFAMGPMIPQLVMAT